MKKTIYLVSLFNDTPINDSTRYNNYLEADLAATKAMKEGRYGMLYRIEENPNASLECEKEVRFLLKSW